MNTDMLRAIPRVLGLFCILIATGCSDQNTEVAGGPVQLRHGQPGITPFWNIHSGRFIYTPAFEVTDSSSGQSAYGVVTTQGSAMKSATLDKPTDRILKVWPDLSPGPVSIQIEKRPRPDSSVVIGSFETIKSPGFDTVIDSPFRSTHEAGMAGLEAVLKMEKVRHWIDPGGPFPGYQLWVHPSKLMGVLSQGMLFLSQQSDNAEIASDAREVALAAANFLLALREPGGTVLEGWTHSYWDGVERGEHPIYMDQIMTLYPSEAAMAFLDLFDETGDQKWWDAAIKIAKTYQATQREDGTWYLLLFRESGEPVKEKLLVPVSVITFLHRLHTDYGMKEYQETWEAAFDWIMENPVRTFAWEAQFEDTRPKNRYRNLSHREAAGFARFLFMTSKDPGMLRLAEELMLFVEDQFVVWSHADAVTRTNWFKDGSKWNGDLPDGGKDWFLPAALEQYAFYTPIAGTTSNVIHAYCAAYDATASETYQLRARALSRSLIDAQEFHGGGEIPTHLRKTLPEDNWLNNSVYSARTLIDASCL